MMACHTCGGEFPANVMFNIRFNSDPRARLQPVCGRCVHELKIQLGFEQKPPQEEKHRNPCTTIALLICLGLAVVWPNDPENSKLSLMDAALYIVMAGVLVVARIISKA